MSGGGPPHHPHGRQAPPTNTAWNHLQVPNYFPSRQPQHAHMSNEHPLLHQPTWHTPTTEPMKTIPHSHIFNLEQMLSERTYPRHTAAPGVDLTLTRNGNQNGDLPTTPISLSVRDTNKINSLPPSALDIQAVELTKSLSPGLKSVSPVLKAVSPGIKTAPMSPGISTSPSQQGSPQSSRKPKRVDSILERLNPEKINEQNDKQQQQQQQQSPVIVHPNVSESPEVEKSTETEKTGTAVPEKEKQPLQSVIVQASNSVHDENSNSNSITPSNIREDEVVSPFSNEDSRESTRRKRKPSKTVKVTKETEAAKDVVVPVAKDVVPNEPRKSMSEEVCKEVREIPCERKRSSSHSDETTTPPVPKKTRRKTSSESETIAKIAAMVNESQQKEQTSKAVSVSVIMKSKDGEKEMDVVDAPQPVSSSPPNLPSMPTTITTIQTPAQRKATNFVEVENKLEEMFAGIEESSTSKVDPLEIDADDKIDELIDDSKANGEPDLRFDSEIPSTSQNQDVTSTSNDLNSPNKNAHKRPQRRKSSKSFEISLKKKKIKKGMKSPSKSGNKKKKSPNGKQINLKIETVKDIYAYDSGSNASSVRSKGPFIQIRGPRDSPISVNIVNTAVEDDTEKKSSKSKKFHDDSEYRHKVRSKGLHCSTLSNKYDAQTKDISWICVFCKRGPHSTTNSQVYVSGDLFGPYVITNNCPEYERRMDDPFDKQFKSKKIGRMLEASGNIKTTLGKKSKRKHSESEGDASNINLGITETGEKTFEIWAHEDCVVWSPGVYLIGPKIIGLEEAIWTSCNVACNKCSFKGANVCCLRRGCTNVVHFGCAVVSNWQLDYDNYKAFCVAHKTL